MLKELITTFMAMSIAVTVSHFVGCAVRKRESFIMMHCPFLVPVYHTTHLIL